MINDFLNNSPVFQPNIEGTSISGDCSPRARRRAHGRGGRGAPGGRGAEEPEPEVGAPRRARVGEGRESGASGRKR